MVGACGGWTAEWEVNQDHWPVGVLTHGELVRLGGALLGLGGSACLGEVCLGAARVGWCAGVKMTLRQRNLGSSQGSAWQVGCVPPAHPTPPHPTTCTQASRRA